MGFRVIDEKTYALLLAAFREQPGNAAYGGRRAGCDRRMAKRAWEEGWPEKFTWARPIQHVLEEERIAARSLATQAEEMKMRQALENRDKATQEATEVLAQEAQLLKITRANLLAGLGLSNKFIPAMQHIVEKTIAAVMSGELTVQQGIVLFNRWARIVEMLCAAVEKVIGTERMRKGDPVEVIGLKIDLENVSPEDVLRELNEMRDMLASAQESGAFDGQTNGKPTVN